MLRFVTTVSTLSLCAALHGCAGDAAATELAGREQALAQGADGYVLSIDGEEMGPVDSIIGCQSSASCGFVQSVEGGHATAEVITEKVGGTHLVHKHIAGVKYEDIQVSASTGTSKAFAAWVSDAQAGEVTASDVKLASWADGPVESVRLDAAKLTAVEVEGDNVTLTFSAR